METGGHHSAETRRKISEAQKLRHSEARKRRNVNVDGRITRMMIAADLEEIAIRAERAGLSYISGNLMNYVVTLRNLAS